MEQEHDRPDIYLQMMYEQNSEVCDPRFFRRRHPGDAADLPLGGTDLEGGALGDVNQQGGLTAQTTPGFAAGGDPSLTREET